MLPLPMALPLEMLETDPSIARRIPNEGRESSE